MNYMRQFLKEYFRFKRYKKILKIIDIPKSGTLLDISSADGSFLNRLNIISPNLNLFGIDISKDNIKKAKTNFPSIAFKIGSADSLDFESNSFNIVFCTMSLHHYDKPKEFLKEVHRVLKQNGILYLTDIFPEKNLIKKIYNWKSCKEAYHFEKFYSVKDLEEMLNTLGFHIVKNNKVTLIPRIRLLTIQKF